MSEPVATGKNPAALLGPKEVRELAERFQIRPTKTKGQNFVHDANTVRRIVDVSGVTHSDHAIEVGPGLGSLTLPLLEAAGTLTAIELDTQLAAHLPGTIVERAQDHADKLHVITADAMTVTSADFHAPPTSLVANLPYNVSVPVLLHLLSELPSLNTVLVMVQAEVADRLAAQPGSKIYGVPSVKVRFYGSVARAGSVGRSVFWPVPNVESGLVKFQAYGSCDAADAVHDPASPDTPGWDPRDEKLREATFAVIDAAFAQRRKTLRSALSSWAGSAANAEEYLRKAGVDPALRGEKIGIEDYINIARAASTK